MIGTKELATIQPKTNEEIMADIDRLLKRGMIDLDAFEKADDEYLLSDDVATALIITYSILGLDIFKV